MDVEVHTLGETLEHQDVGAVKGFFVTLSILGTLLGAALIAVVIRAWQPAQRMLAPRDKDDWLLVRWTMRLRASQRRSLGPSANE